MKKARAHGHRALFTAQSDALDQACRRRLRSQTKATIASTAAKASRPVEASISGTLVTEEPTALSDPTVALDEDAPELESVVEDDPPEALDPPELPGRLERPPMAKTVAVDIANAVAVASAVAASLNTVTVSSLF